MSNPIPAQPNLLAYKDYILRRRMLEDDRFEEVRLRPTPNSLLKVDADGTIVPLSGSGVATDFLRGDLQFATPLGAGDVVGPASSTTNAVAVYSSTSGKNLKNTGVTIDASNNLTVPGTGTHGFAGTVRVSGAVDTTSSGALSIKFGRFASSPSNATDAFIGINDSAGPAGIAGDLVYIPRCSSGVGAGHKWFGQDGAGTIVERMSLSYLGALTIASNLTVSGTGTHAFAGTIAGSGVGALTLAGTGLAVSGALANVILANNGVVNITRTNLNTVGVATVLQIGSEAKTAADGFAVNFIGRDSGNAEQAYAQIYSTILDPTAGSEDGDLVLRAMTAGTMTTAIRIVGSAATFSGNVGFNGTTAIAKPAISGSRAANAALASLLTALASYGLVTDSTSA